MRHVLLLLLIAGSAPAAEAVSPSRALAPSQPDFVARRQLLEQKVAGADAIGLALERIHNALARILAAPNGRICESAEGRSLAARTRPLGVAYRDAVQSSRADAARLKSLVGAPTLSPLLQDADIKAAEQLIQKSGLHVRKYLEMLAWQQRFVDPAFDRCEVTLGTAEGLPGVTPEGEVSPVAVIGIGEGKVCPGGFSAQGRVLLLHSAKACYGASSCDCELRPVLPGAVLGPPGSAEP